MSLLPSGLSGGVAAYQISRSLRFNSADSAYLNRTPATTTNRRTFTWSGWYKRSALGTSQVLFGAGTSTSYCILYFAASDTLGFQHRDSTVNQADLITTQVFRDVGAWYHIMVAVDTTQATSSNRIKIYVNGSQITAFGTATYFSLNYDNLHINVSTSIHYIGNIPTSNFLNGYLTEINFIDGQALTPSSFGQTNASTGVWEPIAYTGTYGTNGFELSFADNSNTTAATLGKDYSGNGNNWTPNNFSVTAGAGNDSLVDTPTSYGTDTGVGGEVRGNYATLNPLSNLGSTFTFTNGNLDCSLSSGDKAVPSTMLVSSGKWYCEMTITAVGTGGSSVGLIPVIYTASAQIGNSTDSYAYRSSGNKRTNSTDSAYGASYTTNDVIGIALDLDAGTLVFYKNGTTQGTAFSSISGTFAFAFSSTSSGSTTSVTANFGQRPFAYTAPSGFKALCTQNLPTPTIGATSTTQANDYFDVSLYTGTGSSLNITGLQFQPDWVWIKGRSGATDHGLYDAVRGVQKQLESNTTTAETTETTGLTAFNSDGFTVGALAQLNTSTATYVGWNWKANGSGSSNTSGTITSTVSANTTAGFSVVTWTSTGANATIGHGLGVAPKMVIVKGRSAVSQWFTWHTGLTSGAYALILNLTDAQASYPTVFNSTTPTSSVFSVGTSLTASTTAVAYCFAEVAGYSAFGKYTGNGSSDGPFIFTGFRPRFILLKRTDTTGNWTMYDTARNPYNPGTYPLYPNLSNAEDPSTDHFDWLSNGFKMKSTNQNTNGGTFIYAAFASNPFKYSLGA